MKPPALAGLARSSGAHVAFAFLAMGGWALFANRAHPAGAMLVAGLVQGAISAAITLVLKRALEAMTSRLTGALAFILPPTITCIMVLAVLAGVHRLADTPEIWATIAVPYTVSSAYAWIYTASLVVAARRASQGASP